MSALVPPLKSIVEALCVFEHRPRVLGHPSFVIRYQHLTKNKENKDYAGSKTLPALIKEKETHWPEVP